MSHSPELYSRQAPAQVERYVMGWTVAIDRALRIDGRTPDELRAVIDYAHRGRDEFWRGNLQSGTKLRKKFAQIWPKAKAAKPARKKIAYNAIADRLSLDEVFP